MAATKRPHSNSIIGVNQSIRVRTGPSLSEDLLPAHEIDDQGPLTLDSDLEPLTPLTSEEEDELPKVALCYRASSLH
jgi:hypothetical protein